MRTNKTMRVLTMLLALLMMLGTMMMAVSCATTQDNGNGKESQSSSGTSGEGGEEDVDQYAVLTKEKFNKTFKMLSIDDKITDFVPDTDLKGETLTDALYTRNLKIEDDYGVKIDVQKGGDYDKVNGTLRMQLNNNLDEFDTYVNQLYSFTGVALKNYVLDFNELPTINLDGEWWDRACRDTLIIDGKNFMMTGDISPDAMLISACMVFNKQMMLDLQKEEPYDLVENGEWTYDKLLSYTDRVTNESLGRYGMTAWVYDVPYSLFYSSGVTLVHFDVDTDQPIIEYKEEKVIKVYEKIYDLLIEQNANYETDVNNYENTYKVFADGKALFADVTLRKISEYLTDMTDDYGIVPEPKYDKAQLDYQSFVNGDAAHMLVAKTEKHPEFVGAILEAMATYNYEHVTPLMYEVVAKSKDARDPESAKMVDIILRNRVYDFAYWANLSIANVVRDQLASGERSVASQLKSAKGGSEGVLDKLIRDYDKAATRG